MEAGIMLADTSPSQKTLLDHFEVLEDPRLDRNIRHKLLDIITIAICAVIANANDWNEIETWAICKKDWLKTFLELPNGIPSHDTFNRVFSSLDPGQFMQCFSSWVHAINVAIENTVIAIDGKRLKRSHNRCFGKSALHLAGQTHLNLYK